MANNLGKIIRDIAFDYQKLWILWKCTEKNNVITCKGAGQINFVAHKDGNSWCGAFVSTIIDEASKRNGYTTSLPMTASTLQMFTGAKNNGLIVDRTPAVGAVFYRRYNNSYCKSIGSDSGCGHVGIITKVVGSGSNQVVYTLEGNSSDSIKEKSYSFIEWTTGAKKLGQSSNYPDGHWIIHTELETTISGKGNHGNSYFNNYYLRS